MSCGRGWSLCWPIPRVVFATRAGSATARVPVWRGSCTCSTPTRPGWRCPTVSWGCPAGRRAGGVWRSGQRRGLLAGALAGCCRPSWPGRPELDWSRVIVDASLVEAKKGARRSRARSWAGREAATTWPQTPTAPRSRCSLSAGNENERRQLLPLVDCLSGPRDPARAAVGRPRLCLGRARAGAARARDRALYLPAAPSRPAHP